MLLIEQVEACEFCVKVDAMDHDEVFSVVFFIALPQHVWKWIQIVQDLSNSLPFLSWQGSDFFALKER